MFTGIVQTTGRVQAIDATQAGVRLRIAAESWDYHPNVGDSVAVNGCCLTHAPSADDPSDRLVFDVVHETLRKTSLDKLQLGSRVNLESCLTPTSHIGGHFVLGHVDVTGTVASIDDRNGEYLLTVATDADFFRYVIPTGSIAIDGVSLTIASRDTSKHQFTVALIPTTLELTTLGQRRVSHIVNLEADVLVKAVVENMPKVG